MSEQSFEELLNEQESVRIHNGSIVTGKVIDVKENEIVLNIGYKSDGICTKAEYSNDPEVNLLEAVAVGDEMEVKVLRMNDGDGQVALSFKRLSQERSIKELEEAFENKTVLTGTVKEAVKGGLLVECQDTTVFIPASYVSDHFESNLAKYIGKEVEFILIEYNPRRRKIVGDCKTLIVEKKEAARKALFDRISVGMIVNGKIKNLTAWGAFVDLDGADGLLHVSEMSWGHINNPKRLFKVGDEVEAYIKEIKDDKVALSINFPEKNPWTEDGPYVEGNIVKGKVVRFAKFGAFVELEPGIDALLHISEISYERIAKAEDVLKLGEEVEAKVTSYTPEKKHVGISIKALLPEPEVTDVKIETPSEEAPAPEPAEEATSTMGDLIKAATEEQTEETTQE